jgi:LPS O-antigen subunit length determinant protein (WzzB/FepE family)
MIPTTVISAIRKDTMPNHQEFPFDFEFLNQTQQPDAQLYQLAYSNISDLAIGHTDIVGAKVSLEELSSGATPQAFQARVVLYVRPEHIAATKVASSSVEALQQALNAATKQIQEKRNKLRNY